MSLRTIGYARVDHESTLLAFLCLCLALASPGQHKAKRRALARRLKSGASARTRRRWALQGEAIFDAARAFEQANPVDPRNRDTPVARGKRWARCHAR